MKRKSVIESRKYLAQLNIALTQVCFAAFWALIFLPEQPNKPILVAINLTGAVTFAIVGWLLSKIKS